MIHLYPHWRMDGLVSEPSVGLGLVSEPSVGLGLVFFIMLLGGIS